MHTIRRSALTSGNRCRPFYPYYFGQSEAVVIEISMGKEEKAGAEMINDVVKKGYNRVQETMKEARQDFQRAKAIGSRS